MQTTVPVEAEVVVTRVADTKAVAITMARVIRHEATSNSAETITIAVVAINNQTSKADAVASKVATARKLLVFSQVEISARASPTMG